MKPYKKWSPKEREQNLKLFTTARNLSLWPKRPECCSFCGQKEGILHIHCEDYDISLKLLPKLIMGDITEGETAKLKKILWDICWRCHMMWHTQDNNPDAFNSYFKEIADGKQYPPVFKHNYKIIVQDHLAKHKRNYNV